MGVAESFSTAHAGVCSISLSSCDHHERYNHPQWHVCIWCLRDQLRQLADRQVEVTVDGEVEQSVLAVFAQAPVLVQARR